jgi:dihydrofolate reductase
MGRLISTTTMTADAVTDVGEWFVFEGEHDRAAREQFARAGAMLTGRTTFEGLAGFWQEQEGLWADAINPMPKYVASRTVSGPLEWNGTVIEGDVAEGVAKLKAELDQDLILIGCGELASHLLERGLVDEVQLWVHPTVWGKGGTRPFEGSTVRMQLVDTTPFDTGVTLLRYEPVPA